MGRPPPFLYLELTPAPALAGLVHAYWEFEVRGPSPVARHTVWPDGCLSFVCPVSPGKPVRIAWSGPRTDPLYVPVREGDRFRGVRLRPYAIGPLLGADPRALRDGGGPAAEILPGTPVVTTGMEAGREAFDALEALLSERAARAPEADHVVRRAVEAIEETGGAGPIQAVASRVGLSGRQLRRRFGAATGLTPKEYARVRRLRKMTEERILAGGAWSRLAARFGYADQAHLVRECARMTGLTPTAFERRLRLIEHRDVEP